MRVKHLGAFFLSALLSWQTAPARSMEYDDFLMLRDATVVDAILIATGNAFRVANSQILLQGDEPLFCQPENLAITGNQLRQILETQAAEGPQLRPGITVEIILLAGLKRTFPC